MPLYSWTCSSCGRAVDLPTREAGQTCPCGSTLRRDYSNVRFGRPAFQPHFNHAVGQYVSTDREFRDALKRGGEAAESTYEPIYPGDRPAPDHEIIETSNRVTRDKGLVVPTQRVFT